MVKLAAEQKQSSPAIFRGPSKVSTLGKQRTFTGVPVTIQPLLTPDKGQNGTLYVDKILNLIGSAKRSVYMQTQYVHPSDKPVDKNFMLLVKALSDAFHRGLDVRLITSQFENTPQWLEKIKPFDLDQVLRIQQRVHNKGIVVDSSIVLVSSQNWSGDGTLRNRDAGLIIDNADVAAYFEALFIDDWTQRANQKIVDESHWATRTPARKSSPRKSSGRRAATRARKKSAKRR
jgi:phosphatidylserine/phosphatidylglycerophosphate/cardiolipin synthase-like enzyme